MNVFFSPKGGLTFSPGKGRRSTAASCWTIARNGQQAKEPSQPTQTSGKGAAVRPLGINGKSRTEFASGAGELACLPPELQTMVTQVSAQAGILPLAVLPAILATAGAAIGSGAFLEHDSFPRPVNAGLACAISGAEGQRIKRALERLTQPLRSAQDQRLVQRGHLQLKDIDRQVSQVERDREAFFGSSLVRDPDAERSFDSRIKFLKGLRHSALISERSLPNHLYTTVSRSGGNGMLIVCDDWALGQSLDCLKKTATEFELLTCAIEGKTPEASFATGNSTPLIRPVVGCILHFTPQTLARLLCVGEPTVHRFVEHLVFVATEHHSDPTSAPAPPSTSSDAWAKLISRLLSRRDSAGARRLTLSPPASSLLKEQMLQTDSSEGRWTRHVPLLSAKVALILHVCSGSSATVIPEESMAHAIDLARRMIEKNATTARLSITLEETRTMEMEAARMLEKVRKAQPATPRMIFRMYDDPSKSLHQPVLDYLLLKGKVHLRQDGRFEIVDS